MRKGFTLVELLIVIAIVGVLSAIAIPNFARLKEVYVTKGEMQRIVAFINLAKTASMKYNDQACITFTKGKGSTLQLFIDSDRDKTYNSGEKVEQTLKLNEELEITSDNQNVCFPPTGIALGVGSTTIIFSYGNQTRKIVIAGYGRIRIEK